ncbi:hypothetical protein A2899_04805 [Candidatus Amesbacteria bacterium RIFCSPLOWO2_01_FULL_49_25]|uniref:Uncharacterized protein n=1 Tax=Candidatus Amesbacteria bacterium RIFCSPHIGHO2_01_FULL_48_32b TaxID=1797253 RepID=A0A1F4YDZ8_9BACT|nr:MAG: hypothetical protein A2876_01785 [Candidatus Amesbacteria bacterium RIFCSPHIGHO2_01_FULL_48_32b]OGD07294.1 MAG: hypothetical protein A2899_04805 [Candidatus Amesbacteria bacterium RIFCSPLOWO2_01_FULL_49_25]
MTRPENSYSFEELLEAAMLTANLSPTATPGLAAASALHELGHQVSEQNRRQILNLIRSLLILATPDQMPDVEAMVAAIDEMVGEGSTFALRQKLFQPPS